MDKQINILVYPCGAENALEVHQALKDVVNISLWGASGKDDHGSYIFKRYIRNFPYVNDDKFLSFLNQTISKKGIDIIIPTHDDVALALAQMMGEIEAKVAVPGLEQALICRSKKKTYQLFKHESFCPVVYEKIDDEMTYPVFIKPDKGQGGKGAFLIEEREKYCSNELLEDHVICEYLPGDELTVDCFSNRHGKLLFIGPRKRQRVFGGISTRSHTVELTPEVKKIAYTINEKLKMKGLWFFQLKKDKEHRYKLLEVSVRVAGTMSLYRGLGINFPLLTVYDLLGYDVEIINNDNYLEVDRALFNRYKHDLDYENIYIDFDDTIIKNEQVNTMAIFFLYNAKQSGKKIRLITKHKTNVHKTLNRLAIHTGLFDEIIHINKNECKYQFMDNHFNSIFIDNSFKERLEVNRMLNIPVFDVDALATLIDWKE